MTDPDHLKSAAEYLLELARTSKGGRYRKSAKIEALRECKEEILEAHRSGISIHRIAQIFRERNVDISTQHLMWAIRLFIKEGQGSPGKGSESHPGASSPSEEKKITYSLTEQASPLVREEEFAKQLRLALPGRGEPWPAAGYRKGGRESADRHKAEIQSQGATGQQKGGRG